MRVEFGDASEMFGLIKKIKIHCLNFYKGIKKGDGLDAVPFKFCCQIKTKGHLARFC